MSEPAKQVGKAVDTIQQRLTEYASEFRFDVLTPEAIHAAKVRVIDTLGCLIGAFFGEPGSVARNLAAGLPQPDGATVIGTRMKTLPDIAAFVNATTARDSEMTDAYHYPGSFHGHPSDIVTPLLAVAEQRGASGRAYIESLVLGYEVFLRFSNAFHNEGFDATNFTVVASANTFPKELRNVVTNFISKFVRGVFFTVVLLQLVRPHLWAQVVGG